MHTLCGSYIQHTRATSPCKLLLHSYMNQKEKICDLQKLSRDEKMESLDKDIRLFIEKQFDRFYDNPEEWQRVASDVLAEQGIQPNLDTILSYLVGMTMGEAYQKIKSKSNRAWTKKEARAIAGLLARRAFEIRQHFLATLFR